LTDIKSQQKFSLKKRFESFRYAYAGLRTLWREEHNVRIHIVAGLIVLVMGFLLHISLSEWCVVTLVVAVVLLAEALNSSLENIADAISEEKNEKIQKAKDLAAAAVLISAIAAVIIGVIIFLPKIIELF